MSKKEILAELNEDQKKPVLDYYGPSFIVAGPGSGKTSTLIARAAYMIEEGISPENILLFTFTRKASEEIKERVEQKIGSKATGITVSTYHSLCSRLLRKYAQYLGYKLNFSVYDEDDKKSVLKKIINDSFIKESIVSSYISDWKNKMISPADASRNAQSDIESKMASYYGSYQKTLKKQNAFDFDDLIYETVRLLRNNKEVFHEVTNKYQYITADEFHDSSIRDLELIKLLAGEKENICMVVDDDQSIYSFRGANIQAVLLIREHFDGLKEFILRRNYRSTQTIVNAARSLIRYNVGQIEKDLFTKNEKGENVVYFNCSSPQEEALSVTKIIMGLLRTKAYHYKDIAILYRMAYLSRPIEEVFLKNSIPYRVVNGCPFYARKEIKDIMSYIRFAYNHRDIQAFERIVNIPSRGIGDKSLEKIISLAKSFKNDTIDLINALKNIKLAKKAQEGINQLSDIINTLNKLIEESASPVSIVRTVIKLTNYNDHLKNTQKDFEEKIANIIELISIADQYETLDDFIYSMALNSDINETEEGKTDDRVQLMTMHASKGLEFKAVIVIGVSDGIIPHLRADTIRQLEEERRLFYVSLTRAEKLLFLTRSKTIFQNGKLIFAEESRFIKEIDSSYLLKTK